MSKRVWKLHSQNASGEKAGRIAWMENPDGTAETYTYTATGNGAFTLVHRKGAGDRNGVTSGMETRTEYNGFVQASAETVKDIASGLTLNFWHAPAVDILGRPTRIEYNGNSDDYETFQYACCGLEHQRKRDASVTTWTRDPLKRIYLQYDYRFATDSVPLTTATTHDGLTTTVTKGGIFQSEKTTLLNGKNSVIKTADQNNDGIPEATLLTYSGGGRIVTVTHPDGGTEIRENYLDGQLKFLTGTAVPDRRYDYGTHTMNGNGLWTQEFKLTSTGGTGEWMVTFQDGLKRIIRREWPYGSVTALEFFTYHGTGAAPGARTQLASFTDADYKVVTYGYDSDGHVAITTEQMPNSQTRITVNSHVVVNDANLGVCEKHITQVNGVVTSVSLRSGDKYSSKVTSLGRVTTAVKTVSDSSGNATKTTTNPDGTKQVQTITGNLLTQVANLDSTGSTVLTKSYSYDALHRVATSTDARTGTTTVNSYTPAGQPLSVTGPGSRTTAYSYDVMGRRISVDAPDTLDASGNTIANVTHTSWHQTSLEKAVWGGQTYTSFKSYDEQGRRNCLRTYRNLAPDIEPTNTPIDFDQTTWIYNPQGLLAAKRYADNQGPAYTYTPGGKWTTRTSASGVVMTQTYDKGFPVFKHYSDTTPNVSILYDGFGRAISISQERQSLISYAYDPVTLALKSETISYDLNHDGTSDFIRVIDRTQDNIQRNTGWELRNGSSVENAVSYGYDASGRLSSASRGSSSVFNYSYQTNSNLISSILKSDIYRSTNNWDTTRNSLISVSNDVVSPTVAASSSYAYSLNALGQRISSTEFSTTYGSSFYPTWEWGYNDSGEIQRALSNRSEASRAYDYDGIGNRKKAADAATLPPQTTDYYPTNALNQHTSINGVNLSYDNDGNATAYPPPTNGGSLSTFSWNGENQLISVSGTINSSSYMYDAFSRRIAKTVNGVTTLYVYDRWNCIADYAYGAITASLSRSYVWGLDLSGTLQGAGGVGGLLCMTVHEGSPVNYYPSYDGNGNVCEYQSAAGVTHFEYDPFGRVVFTSGDPSFFDIRFSNKREDAETGLLYYGYRNYDSSLGRWISRDSLGEKGGINLYGFGGNRAPNGVDVLGGHWFDSLWNFLSSLGCKLPRQCDI